MAVLAEPIKGVPLVKNYINGEWVESRGEIKDVVNPAKYEPIGKVPISTREEIDAAEQSRSLMADVPRAFMLIVRKRNDRLANLRSF